MHTKFSSPNTIRYPQYKVTPMYMVLLPQELHRNPLQFKTKSLHINHVSSLHITTLHISSLIHTQSPTWIPCRVVVFQKISFGLMIETFLWWSCAIGLGSHRHPDVSEKTCCLHVKCFKVPRYSLRTSVFFLVLRGEGNTFPRNVGSYMPGPESSHAITL
jgi:hypothetical protein